MSLLSRFFISNETSQPPIRINTLEIQTRWMLAVDDVDSALCSMISLTPDISNKAKPGFTNPWTSNFLSYRKITIPNILIPRNISQQHYPNVPKHKAGTKMIFEENNCFRIDNQHFNGWQQLKLTRRPNITRIPNLPNSQISTAIMQWISWKQNRDSLFQIYAKYEEILTEY